MRTLVLSLLAATIVISPAAADSKPPYSFGATTCGSSFPCSAYEGYDRTEASMENLIALANQCVRNNFGTPSKDSLFADERGLDGNLCLTTKPLPKATTGATPTPSCCIVHLTEETCQLRCDLLAVR